MAGGTHEIGTTIHFVGGDPTWCKILCKIWGISLIVVLMKFGLVIYIMFPEWDRSFFSFKRARNHWINAHVAIVDVFFMFHGAFNHGLGCFFTSELDMIHIGSFFSWTMYFSTWSTKQHQLAARCPCVKSQTFGWIEPTCDFKAWRIYRNFDLICITRPHWWLDLFNLIYIVTLRGMPVILSS